MQTMKPVEADMKKGRILGRCLLGVLTLISSVFLFRADGIGRAESEIAHVFEYELPVAKERANKRHTVTFTHSRHAMDYDITCVRCHHTLEKGATAVEEGCKDCHEDTGLESYREFRSVSEEERQEHYILVLHDQCIDCHKEIKSHARRSRAPVACWGCHIRKKK